MKRSPSPQRQQGAALVVGLLMLLALTLIGVTNMGMNTMELRMAANAQNKAHAFQAAEAGVEDGIRQTNFNNISGVQTLNPVTFTDGDGNVVGQATITSEHQDFTAGIRCPGGQSFESVRCNNFEIRATGVHARSNAESRQVQGVFTLAPALK